MERRFPKNELKTPNIDTSLMTATLHEIFVKIDEMFKNCTNEVFACYQFWHPNSKQEENDTFNNFYGKV